MTLMMKQNYHIKITKEMCLEGMIKTKTLKEVAGQVMILLVLMWRTGEEHHLLNTVQEIQTLTVEEVRTMMRMCFKEETTSNLMIDQCMETQVKVFETIKIIGKEMEDGEMKWVFREVIFEEGVDLVKIEEIQSIEEVDFGSQQLSQIIPLARVCLVQEGTYLSKESLNLKPLTTVMDRDQFKDFKQEVQE